MQFGVISQGALSNAKNSGTVITGNTLGGAGTAALGRAGVYVGFDDGVQVTNNTVVNVFASNSADVFGIALGSISISGSAFTTNNDVANATVTGNIIGTVLKTDTFSAAGISLGTTNYGTSRIANNSVYGVNANGTSGDFAVGIYVGSAGTTYATTQIYFNSVSMTGARDSASLATDGQLRAGDLRREPALRRPQQRLSTTLRPPRTASRATRQGSYAIGLSAIGLYSSLTSNYNDLYPSGASNHFSSVGVLASTTLAQVPFFDRLSLTAWRNETGKDMPNSISADPLFSSTTNLRPLPGTPLVGAGQFIAGIPNDIVGDPRNNPPTIGAYENAATPPPPANDDFAGADTLTELQAASGSRSGDNSFATVQAGEPAHAGFGPFKSVWYKFTPLSSRTIRFDTCTAGFDTVLAAYTGASVDALTMVAANDDSGRCVTGTHSFIQFMAVSGTTYYVAVAGKTSGAFGSFTLAYTDAFPANDDFASAIPITPPTLPSPVNGTNVGATGEGGEPTPCRNDFPTCSLTGALPLNTVWYRYDATFTGGTVQLDTCANPNFDTILNAYTGSSVDALTGSPRMTTRPAADRRVSRARSPSCPRRARRTGSRSTVMERRPARSR